MGGHYPTRYSFMVQHRMGFTLIELSIVLVIICLIIGGILVGRDLIEASKIRATVSQYEKFGSAVNAFRLKYNGIPGDLLDADAFGFPPITPGPGIQHGNGLIETTNGAVESSIIARR